jgi:hypothetical protein
VHKEWHHRDGRATNALPFRIESEVTKEERRQDRKRVYEAMLYRQSMANLREQSADVQLKSRAAA